MLRILLFALSFTGMVLSVAACSSIRKTALNFYLKGFQDKKAEEVKYIPPPYPYEKQKHPILDALWWNPKSRNSISYFSSCSKTEKTLNDFQMASFPENTPYKFVKRLKSKKSLYSVLEISHPHQKTYSGIYTVKKGKCCFNINFVASSQSSFNAEESIFKAFIKDFQPK